MTRPINYPATRAAASGLHQTCTMPDCNDKHQARGYCWKHLRRVYRHGDPNVVIIREALVASSSMIQAYEDGLTIEAVAKRFHLKAARVGKMLRQTGITTQRPGIRSLTEREYCCNGHELAKVGLYCAPNGISPRCRACMQLNQSRWRSANKGHLRAYNQAHYLAHRKGVIPILGEQLLTGGD